MRMRSDEEVNVMRSEVCDLYDKWMLDLMDFARAKNSAGIKEDPYLYAINIYASAAQFLVDRVQDLMKKMGGMTVEYASSKKEVDNS